MTLWQYNSNELYHYGVPGMKWGVRRASVITSYKLSRAAKKQAKKEKKLARKSNSKNPIQRGRSVVEKQKSKTVSEITSTKNSSSLTDRFNKALKDNPKLTYDKIYKDMKVDMSSEDTTSYKQAEDAWLKRHGY